MAINMLGAARRGIAPGRRADSAGFVASIIVLVVTVPLFAWSLWASHARSMSSNAQAALNVALSDLQATVTTAQSSMRGYVLSGTDAFLEPYRQAAETFPVSLFAFLAVAI